MRMIDADALLEKVQFRLPIDNYNAEVISGCVNITRRLIEAAPTIDAVPVVRCCVCEHWNTQEVSISGDMCRCERFSLVGYSENYTDPMDFCSYGERRSDD